MHQARADQFAEQESCSTRGLEMIDVGAAIGIDLGQKGRDLRQRIKV